MLITQFHTLTGLSGSQDALSNSYANACMSSRKPIYVYGGI